MVEYSGLIALAYFKAVKENYTINDMAKILGYTHNKIEELVFSLISNGYIEYVDDLLRISKKGLTVLIANEMEDLSFSVENINPIHINPDNALGLYDPYVPKGFEKKYDG